MVFLNFGLEIHHNVQSYSHLCVENYTNLPESSLTNLRDFLVVTEIVALKEIVFLNICQFS